MKKIDFLSAKGTPNTKIRNAMREQVFDKMETVLTGGFDEVTANPVGGFSIPLGEDLTTGETIFCHVEFSISTNERVKKTKAKKPTTDEPTVVPILFD